MDKAKLQRIKNTIVEQYIAKSYDDLFIMDRHKAYSMEIDNELINVEIQLLEKNDDFVQVLVSVDDGSFKRFISPLSSIFLVYKNGRVDK